MSKLDKDKVIADFTAAYTAAFGKTPQLEQKPGWFSVDGGKNIRLAELADLGASYSSAKPKVAATKAAPAKSTAKPAAKTAKSNGGKSASALWAERNSAQRQPRGCR
ncbi:hypothetical protein [Rheinheimera maricola]|uniref:Uncharacterized protein n=1 Tax=Rheinheimera maricola TaxID=2793282 RepID=A0ABS7X715_9GAMM|nr:hypothetical protein [Rheinheimera maricola]MBZ9610587.1 hypothetical protein [Rheinheimera maricola]